MSQAQPSCTGNAVSGNAEKHSPIMLADTCSNWELSPKLAPRPKLSSYIAEMKADYYRYIAEFKDKGAELAEVSSSLVPKVQRLNLLR